MYHLGFFTAKYRGYVDARGSSKTGSVRIEAAKHFGNVAGNRKFHSSLSLIEGYVDTKILAWGPIELQRIPFLE